MQYTALWVGSGKLCLSHGRCPSNMLTYLFAFGCGKKIWAKRWSVAPTCGCSGLDTRMNVRQNPRKLHEQNKTRNPPKKGHPGHPNNNSKTSKNAPRPSFLTIFHDLSRFWLPILARRRGANFDEAQLPKMLQACQFLTILTSNSRAQTWCKFLRSSTSKSAPDMPVFNDFEFQIALARRRGANFAKLNFQKRSRHARFSRFWFPNRSRAQTWWKYAKLNFQKCSDTAKF